MNQKTRDILEIISIIAPICFILFAICYALLVTFHNCPTCQCETLLINLSQNISMELIK